MTVCERLRADAADLWEGLHTHPFVRGLAAGTLPLDAFRFYVEQNLQYLPEYARAIAVGVEKAEDLETMRLFSAELSGVLEQEIPENRELLARVVELGAEDRGGAGGMAPATLAYTGFLVSTALAGGPAEVMAAIVPCTWSYGDIGSRLVADGVVHEHPVYAEWIRFFGRREYADVVGGMTAGLERLAAGTSDEERARLSEIFTTSVRLERGFWDMGYGLLDWPDKER